MGVGMGCVVVASLVGVGEEEGMTLSKKAAKKEAMKQEKLKHQQEVAATNASESNPLAGIHEDIPLVDLQSKAVSGRKWTPIELLNEELMDKEVLIRGRVE
ncbi:hypothetical protein NE237_021778 [Protea cynaroides]|uniref:Uncharacterized protein n=1 Tax=Protea cynaroides TaxID=273540 RepID=A0A9Q0HBU5_9MAGN|nr:hypothetical protein NE237_021778 [Protea cynaroides]